MSDDSAGRLCPECGLPNRAGAPVCSGCGRALLTEPASEAPPADDTGPQARWVRMGPAVLAGVGVGLVVLLFVGFLLLRQFGALDKAFAHANAVASASAAPAGPVLAPNTMVSWSAPTDGAPKTYVIDGLTLTLSSRAQAAGNPIPILRVTAPDGRAFDQPGQQGLDAASANFGVGRLDPTATGDQVIFATFTGGAHCCDAIVVLELGPGGWRALDVGSFEGDTLAEFPKDVDGDGVPDLVMEDDRFAYAFAPYAQSFLPPRIYNILNGSVVDVSSQGRYADLYRKDMKIAQADCANHNDGACAAFVADASRLGLHDWAWRYMLANYDAASSWTWPTHCRTPVNGGECPKDQQQAFSDFPDALAAFLTDTGYTAAALAQSDAEAIAPSFDCAGADNAATRLICNTPALAQADRDMAAAYAEAMTRVRDPIRLRDDQRRWIARRAVTPASVDGLTTLYAQRIHDLQAEGGER